MHALHLDRTHHDTTAAWLVFFVLALVAITLKGTLECCSLFFFVDLCEWLPPPSSGLVPCPDHIAPTVPSCVVSRSVLFRTDGSAQIARVMKEETWRTRSNEATRPERLLAAAHHCRKRSLRKARRSEVLRRNGTRSPTDPCPETRSVLMFL